MFAPQWSSDDNGSAAPATAESPGDVEKPTDGNLTQINYLGILLSATLSPHLEGLSLQSLRHKFA